MFRRWRKHPAGRDMLGASIICEACGEKVDFVSTDPFSDAVLFRRDKANGWKCIKDKRGYFVDYCPECYKALREKNRQIYFEDQYGKSYRMQKSTSISKE